MWGNSPIETAIFIEKLYKRIAEQQAKIDELERKQHMSDLNYDAIERRLEKSRLKIQAQDKCIEKLKESLNYIAGAVGCRCHPVCLCFTESQLKIWKEEAQSIAKKPFNQPHPIFRGKI